MAFNSQLLVIMLRLYLFKITVMWQMMLMGISDFWQLGLRKLILFKKHIFLVNVRDCKLNDSPCHFFSSVLHFLLLLAGL